MSRRGALVYLPAAIVLAIQALVLWPVPLHLGDWLQYWYVGHVVASGGNPLDAAAWRDIVYAYPTVVNDFVVNWYPGALATTPETPLAPQWLYPPWTAVMFVPFGVLSLETGIVLLHVALVAGGLAAIGWLVSRLQLPPRTRALALAFAVGVQPFVLATRTGHFTTVLLFGVVLTLIALERRSTATLIGGALIVSLKPHLFVAFAFVVLAVLLRRRQWRTIATTTVTLLAFAAAFYLRYPSPVGGAFGAAIDRVLTDDSATTWALAARIAPTASLLLGLILVAAAGVASWIAVRAAPSGMRPFVLLSAALAVSLAVSPYVHTYDHVLLLPALLAALALVAGERGPVRLALGAAVIAGGLAYPWLAYFSDVQGRQWPSGGVPFAALALLTASVLIASRRWPQRNRRYLRPSPAST